MCRKHIAWLLICLAASGRVAASDDATRQSRDDAWWTGPILAAGAGTLPKGHWLVEPYLYDVISQGRYDGDGNRHPSPRRHAIGSQGYILYGLVDGITVGCIPRIAYNDVSTGPDSSGIGIGDFTLQGAYRLTTFREGSRVPTMSVVLQETLPTGKFDRLGARPSDGLGSGAYTTTLSLYTQYFLWMPNGRILRTRLNFTYAASDTVSLEDVSVYGTGDGFRGHARPGNSFVAGSAVEYSATRNWVLALDLVYQHDASTTLRGLDSLGLPIRSDFGSGESVTLAPAVEYNWNSRMGVIVGAIFTAAGRNASATVVPVAAVNMVF